MSRPGNRQRYKSTNQGGKLPQSTAMLLEQAPEQPNHTTLVLSQKTGWSKYKQNVSNWLHNYGNLFHWQKKSIEIGWFSMTIEDFISTHYQHVWFSAKKFPDSSSRQSSLNPLLMLIQYHYDTERLIKRHQHLEKKFDLCCEIVN